jgi:hypothetical protein
MACQESFNKFVEEYNQDYVSLLTRASRARYGGLLRSFATLKDVYEVIQLMFNSGGYV